MTISLITIVDQNYGIGYKGELLAHLPLDLKHFKRVTMGKVVLSGRKSYESILKSLGKPLPNRKNVVMTRNRKYDPMYDNVDVVTSIGEFLKKYQVDNPEEEVFIIGGSELYNMFLPHADKIYLTQIHHSFENVDAYFPRQDHYDWKVDWVKSYKESPENKYPLSFYEITRRGYI